MNDVLPDFLDQLGDAARGVAAAATARGYDNKLAGGTQAGGFDPVTAVDRAIEVALRDMISTAFPGDAIRGEEYGASGDARARRVWSLDPIDGTRAFICGLPSWAVLVGVIEDSRHVAGMIDLPALGERVIGAGGETRRDGVVVRTSGCGTLAQARLATTDSYLFAGAEAAAFERVRVAALMTRYGLDAMAYARVACGDIDLVVESGLKRHDLDALVAVVRGAGGTIGDWTGGEDWDGGRIVAAASEALYAEAVALLDA